MIQIALARCFGEKKRRVIARVSPFCHTSLRHVAVANSQTMERHAPRHLMCSRWALAAIGAGCLFPGANTLATGSAADDFPNKPIRILVGYSAGSIVDVAPRVVGARLVESWKQQVIVENRPSAGGIIAAQMAANANADGYTLLSVSASHAVAPAIYSKLPYDTVRDFAGITTLVNVPAILVVNKSLGVKTVADLIALAKAKPGQLNFASAGIGSATHFSAEMFNRMAGVNIVHVPYKWIPEALNEVMSGRVQYFLSSISTALPLVNEGKLLALGVASPKRSPTLPGVPTIAESGLPGYTQVTWFGLLAPAKTPRPVVEKIHQEISRILDLPDMRQRWAATGAEAASMTPAQFDKLIASDIDTYTKLARAANIKAD
jgi:tripartite-type tricarboxylate transporter receptor subunit TctC